MCKIFTQFSADFFHQRKKYLPFKPKKFLNILGGPSWYSSNNWEGENVSESSIRLLFLPEHPFIAIQGLKLHNMLLQQYNVLKLYKALEGWDWMTKRWK